MAISITTKTIFVDPEPWVTESQMETLCCTPTTPPPCRVKVEPWTGYTTPEIYEKLGITVDENGLDENGLPVSIRLIRPESGSCGEKVTTYELVPANCCEGALALAWNDGLSVSVLSPGGSGVVGVTGGRGPYTYKIFGNDVSFISGQRTITTDEKSLWIYAGSGFCGSAIIEVSDICGNDATGYVKSTVGQWVLTGFGPCHYPGCGEFNYYVETTCIRDNYKVVQLASSAWSVPCSGCTHEEAAAAIAGLCSTIPSGETPCFDIPSNWYPCGGNNNYWTQSGSSVLLIQFSLYKAYEWKC